MAETQGGDVLVSFRGVQKSYDGETLIVKDLNLDIRKGEFLTLLGPSGSGKTTSLMMLAGFETPTAGEILLAGRSINNVPPHKRDIGMVFQNYALFPHMTVAENLAFPLSVRGMSKTDVKERVKRALSMVQLDAFAGRYPAQLSGGQQQRVALARALVFEPQLVLMDEPLGALDKQLREHMQMEIKHLHQRLALSIRPERVRLNGASESCVNRFSGRVAEFVYLGDHVRVRLEVCGRDDFFVKQPIAELDPTLSVGDVVPLGWQVEHVRALDPLPAA